MGVAWESILSPPCLSVFLGSFTLPAPPLCLLRLRLRLWSATRWLLLCLSSDLDLLRRLPRSGELLDLIRRRILRSSPRSSSLRLGFAVRLFWCSAESVFRSLCL